MGKFYVTMTTFTYTHVIRKTTNISPTMFGPIFVHTEKSYESYYYFFSTLLKLEPRLARIIAVGTDGELAITKATKAVFGESVIQLRCFIHMKDNIRRKLTDFLLPERTREEITKDIFGYQMGSVYVKGILDAESAIDFDLRLSSHREKWDSLEQSIHPQKDPQVYRWILKNEAATMKESMIAPVRESAGLGSPPTKYSTNRNECMNNVAKSHTDYHKCSWVQLANNMYTLITDQLKEIEKAVIGMGEFQFKLAYKSLEISSNQWFKMSCEQRKKHLKRVIEIPCSAFELDQAPETDSNVRNLSIPPERCGITSISAEVLESTWKKAEKLLNTAGSICKAPGMPDAMCVASSSGDKPHVVSKTSKGNLTCDDACLAWKCRRFCSHVLAVAEEFNCLNEFLSSYKFLKISGNYTAVCMHNQPKNVGQKPGCPKRKGPSQYKKPDIDSYVDPFLHNFSSSEPLGNVQMLSTASSSSTSQQSTILSDTHSITSIATTSVPSSPMIVTSQQTGTSTNMNTLVAAAIAQLIQPTLTNQIGQFNFNSSCQLPINASQTQVSATVTPFEIKILTPAIKICAGCRKGYMRASDGKKCLPPPYDLCLVHKEQHLYYNVQNARQQFSPLSNVHYHANVECPKVRFANFVPSAVLVPDDLKPKLLQVHKDFLFRTFNITIA